MSISSILNQSTIQYNQYIALHGAPPSQANYHSSGASQWSSPSPPANRRQSDKGTTKSWVQRTFYSTPVIRRNTSSPPPKSRRDHVNRPEKKKQWVASVPLDRDEHPSTRFSKVKIDEASEVFKFCLVGKFPRRRPSLEQLRGWALREWKLRGNWSITLLDCNHVFIRLDNADDMIRVWPRSKWFVAGNLMKIFKWVPTFRSDTTSEPSSAAVWISLPSLPVVLFQEKLLYQVASLVGKVVTMDSATRNLSRTNVARVCVEVDLAKKLPQSVKIEIGDVGFLQEVVYEKLPYYCTHCCKQGHSTNICKFKKEIDAKGNDDSHSVQEKNHSICTPKTQSLPNAAGDLQPQTCPAILSRSGMNKRVTITDNTSSTTDSKEKKQMGKSVEVVELEAIKQGKLSNASSKLHTNSNGLATDAHESGVIEKYQNEVAPDPSPADNLHTSQSEDNIGITETRIESQTFRKRSRLSSAFFFWKRNKVKAIVDFSSSENVYHTAMCYTYAEIKRATNNFDLSRLIGQGGFGAVYRGSIHGIEVAVKCNSLASAQGQKEFEAELRFLSTLRHKNLVKLIGFCIDKRHMMLVYEYISRGNLKELSYGSSGTLLTWQQRIQTCIGAARGLCYLHENSVVHRDVKTHNILIDQDYEAKISDLGLGRLQQVDLSNVPVTTVAGTIGYLDPMYYSTGRVTTKNDVYSFGVVLFEVLCGRPPTSIDPSEEEKLLVGWAQSLIDKGNVEDIVDTRLKGFIQSNSLHAFVELALSCISLSKNQRPTMVEVISKLERVYELQEVNADHHGLSNTVKSSSNEPPNEVEIIPELHSCSS